MRRFTLSTRLPGEQQRQRSRARSRKASKAAREGGASSVPKLATPKKKMTALLVDAVCAAVDVPMSLQCRRALACDAPVRSGQGRGGQVTEWAAGDARRFDWAMFAYLKLDW